MKRLVFSLFIILFLTAVKAQNNQEEIGKIYTKSEAEGLYGAVNNSIDIATFELQNMIISSPEYLMFRLEANQLLILNAERTGLYPLNYIPPDDTEFTIFSTGKLVELINKGNGEITSVENRNCILTISNGSFTLEYGFPCPPVCD